MPSILSDGDKSTGPNVPFATYVVGDIHGRMDLLERLLEQIDSDIVKNEFAGPRLVFVGDYIDRGDASAGVLERLYELTSQYPENVTCLLGNHEAMLLKFLDDPLKGGRRWMRYGGLQTLASFRVPMAHFGEVPPPDEMISAAACLRDRLGPIEHWLRKLPLIWGDQNLFVVHAGADPASAIDKQNSRTLLWGHPDFGRVPRTDDKWVVHGHTIVDQAISCRGIISVDTGAVYSGTLSAAAIGPTGQVRFLQTK